jgi:branched-chain amino acid aminotransferase
MANIHFLNGKLVAEDQLLISPRDLGYSRGYAVFDFLKTYPHHKPFMLQRYIDRLYRSADVIGLLIPWKKQQLTDWIFETLNANKTDDEKVIRITISGGPSNTLLPPDTPTIVIIVDPAINFTQELYDKGVNIHLVEFKRYKAEAKTNNYIEAVKQIQHYKSDEIVYYSNNVIHEGATSNIFAVIGNQLLTPKSDVLNGITRGVLLEILKLDILIEVKDFSVEDLRGATEVFLSVSGKEIVPVTKISGDPVGNGKVGPITKSVMQQFHDYVYSDLW